MKIEVTYIESSNPLGTQDGSYYSIYPNAMPIPDFSEKH